MGGRALPTPQHGRWRRVCTSDGGGGITRARRALSRGALVLDSQRRHLVLDSQRRHLVLDSQRWHLVLVSQGRHLVLVSQRRHRCCWIIHVHGLP